MTFEQRLTPVRSVHCTSPSGVTGIYCVVAVIYDRDPALNRKGQKPARVLGHRLKVTGTAFEQEVHATFSPKHIPGQWTWQRTTLP